LGESKEIIRETESGKGEGLFSSGNGRRETYYIKLKNLFVYRLPSPVCRIFSCPLYAARFTTLGDSSSSAWGRLLRM